MSPFTPERYDMYGGYVERTEKRPPLPPGMPTKAFIVMSWLTFAIGVVTYVTMLVVADVDMSTRGHYVFTLALSLGLATYSQRVIRHREGGVPVSNIKRNMAMMYLPLAMFFTAIVGTEVQSWSGTLVSFGLALVLSVFSWLAILKNRTDVREARAV